MKHYWLKINHVIYKYILAKVIFLFNSELIHNLMTLFGEILGKVFLLRKLIYILFNIKYNNNKPKINNIKVIICFTDKPTGPVSIFIF